jgi:mRNA interferase MazF
LRRGELYRVYRPPGDPKKHRTFVIVSRQLAIASSFSTVICAPIFTDARGLSTQVPVGPDEGLKHDSWIMCDSLDSIFKTDLTQYVGSLSPAKLAELDSALKIALGLD